MAIEFTLFPQLPTELRLMIWQLALPPPITNPLYPYKQGCWVMNCLTEEHPSFQPDGVNACLGVDTSLLDPPRIELPLNSVSYEARSVARKYAERHKLVPMPGGNRSDFIRFFNFAKDFLFIPTDRMFEFFNEPDGVLIKSDLGHCRWMEPGTLIPRLAISASGLRDSAFRDILCFMELDEFRHPAYVVDHVGDGLRDITELEEGFRARYVSQSSSPGWKAIIGADDDEDSISHMEKQAAVLDEAFCMRHLKGNFCAEVRFVHSITRRT